MLLSFCIRIEIECPKMWNVSTKNISSPPFGVVTNRPPMYAASLRLIIQDTADFVNESPFAPHNSSKKDRLGGLFCCSPSVSIV